MPLVNKHKMTEQKLAANRLNGLMSRGAVTPAGKARVAAANLRHGYYSESAEVALAALGENPAEFQRRLQSLVDTYEPANALEMSLVMQLARALWRMERFHRMAESLAVNHLEQARKNHELKDAILLMPFIERMERLKELFNVTCADWESNIGPEEMQVFENCRGDLPEEKAKEVLVLLLRLRKPGVTDDLGPAAKLLDPDGAIPAAEGEERMGVRRELGAVLARQVEPLEKRILGHEEDPVQAQLERDKVLADAQPKAALMNQGEESSLRQVLRITKLLMNIKRAARLQEKIENAECSQDVIENKWSQNGQNAACQDVYENK
jgi:hypothetical protein